jgi:glycosyltransferase involved in cell wall biosynthesis
MDRQSSTTDMSVSAIIALYNPDLHLFEKALLSVLSQTCPVKEIVLVNDGGEDNFKAQLPDDLRIKVFSKPNEGVAAARNFGIAQCTSEYIAFLDQDDFWYPDKIQEQLDLIPLCGEHCMVTSPIHIINLKGDEIYKKSQRTQALYFLKASKKKALLHLAYENFIYSSTPLIHRSVFDKAGLFDSHTQPHDDWDMYLRIVHAGFPVYFYREKPLSVWRMHDSNESHKVNAMLRSKCLVEKKMLSVAADPDVRKVLKINLQLDYVELDNILYKERDYIQFRSLILPHLRSLLQEYAGNRGAEKELDNILVARIQKIVLKSIRRYLFSFYCQAMQR